MATTLFDVLVVYTDKIALSPIDNKTSTPFHIGSQRSHYNDAYAYFLQSCSRKGLNAAFTTVGDIFEKKTFKRYWTFEHNKWIKNYNHCISNFIFDKFSSSQSASHRVDLFSGTEIEPFNNYEIFELFNDKHKTYQGLAMYCIPTVEINHPTKKSVNLSLAGLHKLISCHSQNTDFTEKLVLKDRFGAGGHRIYKIEEKNAIKDILHIMSLNKNTKFVIQPFTNFLNGYSYKSNRGYIDIRIIYLNGKAVQTYLRIAKENDFRCNEHQGGKLEYIQLRELPKKVRALSDKIAKGLNSQRSLFALDFIISSMGNIYLIEGNTGPGIDWNLSLKKNEKNAKFLINEIVASIAERVGIGSQSAILPSVNNIIPTPFSHQSGIIV